MSQAALDYDDAKDLARATDPAVRCEVAARADIAPELLFFLAADPEARVRLAVAANGATPYQADMLLAEDGDLDVRQALAHKVLRLLQETENRRPAAARRRQLLETIEQLTLDQAALVRRILAEALKANGSVPRSVIERLASDLDDLVSVPVLEFSPLLTEESLTALIVEGLASSRLCAISRRRNLGPEASDAIIGSDDEAAVTALLNNHSAQIREDTLDLLVERASAVRSWHAPLVRRPQLSGKAVRTLAGFVARSLIHSLLERADLDQETARTILRDVSRRLAEEDHDAADQPGEPTPDRDEPDDEALVAALTAKRAIADGDRDGLRLILSERAGIGEPPVERILGSGNPKALTALAWKASLPPAFAVQLQLKIGGIMPTELLQGKAGQGFPLSPEEMDWQLESFS